MEVPFKDARRNVYGYHIDALMFDRYVALFVESKRIYNIDKMEELWRDYERMTLANLRPVIDNLCLRPIEARKLYRVVLAETWSSEIARWWMGEKSS